MNGVMNTMHLNITMLTEFTPNKSNCIRAGEEEEIGEIFL